MKKIDITNQDEKIITRLKNGNDLDRRVLFIFQILLYNYRFKSFVKRMKSLIAQSGVTDTTEIHKKLGETIYEKAGEFVSNENIYLHTGNFRQYILIEDIISDYVIYGDIKPDKDIAVLLYSQKTDGIRIDFSPYATKKEMIHFIDSNWDLIKTMREVSLGNKKAKERVNPGKNFVRDIQIFNRYQALLSTHKSERKSTYVEMQVANEFGDKVEYGTIKSIVSRVNKNLKKINNL